LVFEPDATPIDQPLDVPADISLEIVKLPIPMNGVSFGVDCNQHVEQDVPPSSVGTAFGRNLGPVFQFLRLHRQEEVR
jgi:hypothetical protein